MTPRPWNRHPFRAPVWSNSKHPQCGTCGLPEAHEDHL